MRTLASMRPGDLAARAGGQVNAHAGEHAARQRACGRQHWETNEGTYWESSNSASDPATWAHPERQVNAHTGVRAAVGEK